MANYLITDENDIAINYVTIEDGHTIIVPMGHKVVPYDGPFYPGEKYTGGHLVHPDDPLPAVTVL